ncbi:lantibiotic immunity ABC transporter MutE/EpiE family permease subunit [Paenibacillus sp. S-38]|uniref:lantibiotic immunity ABC transporter MutE/EpiE family permease subunit n=1 Tax=Paenibacillus sp. S-38 TaxID=3416710 RepID=UPI003CE9FE66
MWTEIAMENLKMKRTFTKKLIWLTPIATMLLSALLMGGHLFKSGSYNWFYTLMLPGAIALLCTGVVQKDSGKLRYRALLGLPVAPSRWWSAKIGASVFFLFLTFTIFFIGLSLGGYVFEGSLSLLSDAVACLMLFLAFVWQVPLCMLVVEKLGSAAALIFSVAGNMAGVAVISTSSLWWSVPYGIASRIMIPLIGVLPNGIPVNGDDPLTDSGVVLPGVMLSLLLFAFLSMLTSYMFRKREAV